MTPPGVYEFHLTMGRLRGGPFRVCDGVIFGVWFNPGVEQTQNMRFKMHIL